jgi:hypothetical protein
LRGSERARGELVARVGQPAREAELLERVAAGAIAPRDRKNEKWPLPASPVEHARALRHVAAEQPVEPQILVRAGEALEPRHARSAGARERHQLAHDCRIFHGASIVRASSAAAWLELAPERRAVARALGASHDRDDVLWVPVPLPP